MLLCGFLAFAAPLAAPWWHLIAIGFGVGAGFTLYEFALWVRLEDVCWAEDGRASFDAVVCTVAFATLVVIGTRPFGLDEPSSIAGTAAAVTVIAGLAVVCFAKGRVLLGSSVSSSRWSPSSGGPARPPGLSVGAPALPTPAVRRRRVASPRTGRSHAPAAVLPT